MAEAFERQVAVALLFVFHGSIRPGTFGWLSWKRMPWSGYWQRLGKRKVENLLVMIGHWIRVLHLMNHIDRRSYGNTIYRNI